MTTSLAENVVPVSARAKRIENAKQFLKENLIEIIACAVRIHDLTEITLYSSISREKNEKNEAEKAKCFYFYEVDDLYYESRSEVKKQ
jgi:hypothetical protein